MVKKELFLVQGLRWGLGGKRLRGPEKLSGHQDVRRGRGNKKKGERKPEVRYNLTLEG